jgi:hypothetical protein
MASNDGKPYQPRHFAELYDWPAVLRQDSADSNYTGRILGDTRGIGGIWACVGDDENESDDDQEKAFRPEIVQRASLRVAVPMLHPTGSSCSNA